jgi:hypothetical protein
MGWGLGKNSPIVLSLGKGNYEAMLDRHGQNVRWMVSRKCTCQASPLSNNADPDCPLCGGSGERYDFQREYIDSIRLRSHGGYVELPDDNEDCEVIQVFDAMGRSYATEKTGTYVKLSNPVRDINNGEVVEVVFKQSIIRRIEEVQLQSIGNGFYRIPGVQSDRSNIEGVTYTAPGDIITIDTILDSQGKGIAIGEYRCDMVLIDDKEEVMLPITAFGVRYIKPFKFFVLSQDLTEEDKKIIDAHEGSALLTFPYKYNVSENDVITVLSGTQTKKIALKRRYEAKDDRIQEFFVHSIPYLATSLREYQEGIDFIMVGTNKIHWICEDPPEANTTMSITYQYFPTYRVFMSIPTLRTSEDQRIPRKVVLKLLSGFNESRKINAIIPQGGGIV